MIEVGFFDIIIFAVFSVILSLYGIFVFLFYRFMSKRDFFNLNLKKHDYKSFESFRKSFELSKYLSEYAVIYPLFSMFWLFTISVLFFFLNKSASADQIFFIAAGLVGGTRITAYFSEDLSKDMAKLIPFSMLGVALVDQNFFNFDLILERIQDFQVIFGLAPSFLVFSFFLELFLRLGYTFTRVLRKV